MAGQRNSRIREVGSELMDGTNTRLPISMDASNKNIDGRIKKLRKQMLSTDKEIQEIILLVVDHAMGIGNGDVTRIGYLLDAIPQTYRRSLVQNYINNETVMRVRLDTKNGVKQFKASIKDDDAIDEMVKSFTDAQTKKFPDGLSWEQTKKHVGAKDDEGNFTSAFFHMDEVNREPGLFTIVDADDRVSKLADYFSTKLKKQTSDDGKRLVNAADVPAIRALETALRQVHKDYKEGKLAGMNDDNTLVQTGGSTQEGNVQTRTGTDG